MRLPEGRTGTVPLVPAYVDLRPLHSMPIEIRRFLESRAMAVLKPKAYVAWLRLILISWHQVPAGSIPDDDFELASLAGYGRQVRGWRDIRDEALYGWVLCTDGRWYHPVVSEKALVAWEKRLPILFRAHCGVAARRGEAKPEFEVWREATYPQIPTKPCHADNQTGTHDEPNGGINELKEKEKEKEKEKGKEKGNIVKDSCAEPEKSPGSTPAVPPSPQSVIATLPIVGTGKKNAEADITASMVAEWAEAYPGVDVPRQLVRMRQWCLAKPNRRKTVRGLRAFITSWLDKEQNKADGQGEPRGRKSGMDEMADTARKFLQEKELEP